MERNSGPGVVIAVWSASGDIRPLRLRVEDEEQGLIRVNIDEVSSVKEVPYVGVEARIFLCRGTVDGRQRQFALKYLIRAHCWCLMDRVY